MLLKLDHFVVCFNPFFSTLYSRMICMDALYWMWQCACKFPILQINFRYIQSVKTNGIQYNIVKLKPSFTCINLFTLIFLFTDNVNETIMSHSVAWNFQSLLSRWNTVLNSGKRMFCKYWSRIVYPNKLYLWIKIFWNI